jgi:DNA-binding NarL/FixJ family response regulator
MTKRIENTTPEPRKFRVLLADESIPARQSLREELQQTDWIEVVAEADTSQDTIALCFKLRPDVAVISACLPGEGGFEVIRCITRVFPYCLTVLTARQSDSFVRETARLLGASAVCCIAHLPTELLNLLRRLSDGTRDRVM